MAYVEPDANCVISYKRKFIANDSLRRAKCGEGYNCMQLNAIDSKHTSLLEKCP